KKLSFDPKLKKRKLSTRFRTWLLVAYLSSPFKFKAPKGIRTTDLPTYSAFTEMADKYRKNRAELRAFLAKLPDDLMDKEIYKHPFAGRLPLSEMLLFFEVHFRRHEKQARRALEKA
ncbi:MAG: DinB family protein, partial [Phaeodactylibacter sp.]|nr:DinB family protein [Phaeodactylibacter sp.]